MRRKILSVIIVLAGIMSAVALTACSAQSETTTVRLSEVTHSIFYAPQYVAMANGYFAEEGIEIELTNGGGADKVMSAVISGGVDIGLAGPEASIYVYNEGRDDYTQVFAQLTACDGSFLVAREPMPDFTFEHLKGAHVLPGRVGGVPYMALRYAIQNAGLDPDSDINMDTSIQFDMMTGAFLSGTADFVTMFEPTASSVQQEGKGYIVASVGESAGPMPYTAYFTTKSYIENNAELLQGFTNAIAKGQKFVNEHTAQEIAECVATYFADTDIDILTSAVQSYKDIGAYSATPSMTKEDFDRLQDVIICAGELSEPVPFDVIINNTFADKAVG